MTDSPQPTDPTPDRPEPTVGADPLTPALRMAISRLARVPQLLVACDYDGTVAPIVDDPAAAAPLPETVAALRSLASLPQTTVAVVSGRALRDLAALSRLPSEIHLVGSHGSEFDVGFVRRLDPETVRLRDRLQVELERIVADQPGVRLELKPASVAVHLRTATPEVADRVIGRIHTGPAAWPDVHVTAGKMVIEISVIATNKGAALDTLRMQSSATAVLFVGDDVTDENAFARLRGPDVGIKIGAGETGAGFRVASPLEAARVLGVLLETRRRWLYGEKAVPIERHTMLSNGRTVALLTPDATVTWMCHPWPDSTAIFAELLGDAAAGRFSISHADRGRRPLGQRYRPGTMTVETRWSGLTVTDWLACQPYGRSALVRELSGSARASVVFAPRPEFGQVAVRLQPLGDGLMVLGSAEPIALYSPGVEWEIFNENDHQSARATIDLAAMGGRAVLELRPGSSLVGPDERPLRERRDEAERYYLDWATRLKLPGTAREAVLRSALTLRGLWHEPTGAFLAAATTSLPEEFGGIRNWDYRYCWLRDAAMSARVLVDLGSTEEAEALLDWTLRVVEHTATHPERLHPLYALDGAELGPEAVIETLPGYAGSRPVRVGNAANRQVQLDVFGPVTDLILAVARARGSVRDKDIELARAMVSAVQRRWMEPDHGIWEARLPPRHHVYSKVMCWLTVDRALELTGDSMEIPERPEWEALRDQIAENVLELGWHPQAGAYTVAYDHPESDASSLWIGLSGLLADDDQRFLATALKIEADLRSGPTVYRYHWDDGLSGLEGGMNICTTWLIEAYLRTGRRADAEELFDQLLDIAGPTGLLPEQYDPHTERGLGNHPQAYTHLGLIRCALLLDQR